MADTSWLDGPAPSDEGLELVAVIPFNEDYHVAIVVDQDGDVALRDTDDGHQQRSRPSLWELEEMAHAILAYGIKRRAEQDNA